MSKKTSGITMATAICSVCGRRLTSKRSIKHSMGRKCHKSYKAGCAGIQLPIPAETYKFIGQAGKQLDMLEVLRNRA